MRKHPQIVIEESVYDMTPEYKAGARACRRGSSYRANPHRDGSQRAENWNFGYEHEGCGEHVRGGVDLIECSKSGQYFDEDPNLTRDEWGKVVALSSGAA